MITHSANRSVWNLLTQNVILLLLANNNDVVRVNTEASEK